MVAQYRCNEIKEEAMELVNDKLVALKKDTEYTIINDFPNRTTEILKSSINYYDEQAI
jgi:hypothetical protein